MQVNREIQGTLPGIDFAPELVRDHGLREAHTYPLVADGKHEGVVRGSFRVPAAVAWSFASLELRSATAWPVLILDCDGRDGYARAMLRVEDREIKCPNFATHREGGDRPGGAHLFWCLEHPVLRGAGARERPLKLLARVSEYMGQVVGADASYNGVLSHNPMVPDQGQNLKTDWMRKRPYSLAELAEVVPFGWKRPAVPSTAVGRNFLMFQALMIWAGSPQNIDVEVLSAAMSIYREIEDAFPATHHSFPVSEVRGLARSVERYRSTWIKQGKFYTVEERKAWGSARGVRSGVSRRKGTVLEHDRAPWLALGVSRATWYRRRSKRLHEAQSTPSLFDVEAVA